jgi:glucose-6-phosphate-specific signal transduction histidine kinase
MNGYGRQLLGQDGYSVKANQKALIQTSHYLSVFATEPYPLEDGQMGLRLLHAVDPAFTDNSETSLIVGLVLSATELLPPLAHIERGLAISLFDGEGAELVKRDNRQSGSDWMLPVLSERRSISRFGQSSELLVEKQLFWRDMNWPVGLVVLMFSVIAFMVSAQGVRRREEAALEMLKISQQQANERDLLELRVQQRTQELVSRNSELRHQVKENRNLIQKVLEIQETERRNIARELHDEMGQALTAIRTDARLLQLNEPDHSSVGYAAASAIDSTALRIYGVTYGLMRALRPSALDDLGLVDALKQCVDSFNLASQGIEQHLQLSGALNELPESICIQCYRIVQEALNNCVKYAQANNLWLSVSLAQGETNQLVVRIEDDGIGFDPKTQNSGFGLIGMRERALAHEGHFEVCSTPGQGTWIQVELSISELSTEVSVGDSI